MIWDWRPINEKRELAAQRGASSSGRMVLREAACPCAFCGGRGERRAGSICAVCSGTGEVHLEPPAVTCAYCGGRGEVPPRSGLACCVCQGRGRVSIEEPVKTCLSCRGRGRKTGATLYCFHCRGVGVVSAKSGSLNRSTWRPMRERELTVSGGLHDTSCERPEDSTWP